MPTNPEAKMHFRCSVEALEAVDRARAAVQRMRIDLAIIRDSRLTDDELAAKWQAMGDAEDADREQV